jgi:SAM-dependent methyltransferase
MQPKPPDWRLPSGVTPELWEYLTDSDHAQSYDHSLADTPLLEVDRRFVEAHCLPPGRLLDLGCGTGRLLLPFAKRGYWTVGVDLSEEMLRIVGQKGLAAGVTVHRVRANIVDLGGLADGTFDYAACLFSTLGMVAGSAHRQSVVQHVHRLLRPGGTFVVHVHNRWFNFWDRAGRRWLIQDLVRSAFRAPAAGDRPVLRHDGTPAWSLHHFTRGEIIRLLRHNGFEITEVQPLSLQPDGQLRLPRWFGWLRAYGYLIAARRPR